MTSAAFSSPNACPSCLTPRDPTTGEWTCRYWGKGKDGRGGCLGCDDVEQTRAAKIKKSNAVADEYRSQVYADRPGYTFGGYPSFMREKAQTTPFDWPALSAALNTSNADASDGAGGALKPLNSPTHAAKRRRV